MAITDDLLKMLQGSGLPKGLLDALSPLTGAGGGSGGSAGTPGTGPVSGALATALSPLIAIQQQALALIQKLVDSMNRAASPASGGGSSAISTAAGAASGAGGAAGGLSSLAGAAGAAMGAFSAVAGAVGVATGAFNRLTSSIVPFVEAFNPTTVMVFQRAIYDLNAVIGLGLQPVLQSATGVVRDFAGMLLPVMRQLQPAFAQMGELMRGVLGAGIDIVGGALRALAPVIKKAASGLAALKPVFDVFGSLGAVLGGLISASMSLWKVFMGFSTAFLPVGQIITGLFRVLSPILQTLSALLAGASEVLSSLIDSLGETLAGMFGTDFKGVIDAAVSAIQNFAKSTILAAATLLQFVDSLVGTKMANAFAKGVSAALMPSSTKEKTEGIGAAKNASVTGFVELSKEVTAAAFLAQAGGEPKDKQEAWKTEIVNALTAIANTSGKGSQSITQTIDKVGDAILDKLVRDVYESPVTTAISTAILGPSIRLGR